MDICTFWFGDRLRFIDRICLASQVMSGQRVKLYSYKPVENVPFGVEMCDAEPILPFTTLARLDPDFPHFKPSRTIVQLSDFFRIMLMKYEQGIWLDSDVYLIKPFMPDQGEGANPVPPWLGFKKRRLRPFLLRMQGKPVQPNRLGITIFGNDGITRLAKHYHFFHQAKLKNHFYYWTGRKAERIFDPAFGLEPLEHPDFIGFHVHKKAQTQQKPQLGSLFEWMVRRVS